MESDLSVRAQPSAIWLRQEFPVQRNKTFVFSIYLLKRMYGQKTYRHEVASVRNRSRSLAKGGFLAKTLGQTRQQHFMGLAMGWGQTVVHPQALLSWQRPSRPFGR